MSARAILLSIAFPASPAVSFARARTAEIRRPEIRSPNTRRGAHGARPPSFGYPCAKLNPVPAAGNFLFCRKRLENKQGTYTEVWVSDSQWRRETVVNDFHRVEIGTSNRIWKLDHTKDFPEVATRLPRPDPDLMNIFPSASTSFEFESITDSPDQKGGRECATTKPGSQQEQYRFCFDKQSGAFLAKLSPEIRPDYVAVDAIGKPENMTASESGGKRLDEAALEAARKWRFKPATCNGEPIPVQINIRFNF
jgi:TonB family protein